MKRSAALPLAGRSRRLGNSAEQTAHTTASLSGFRRDRLAGVPEDHPAVGEPHQGRRDNTDCRENDENCEHAGRVERRLARLYEIAEAGV